jgi:Spx/MgsR family transcriptional regulator
MKDETAALGRCFRAAMAEWAPTSATRLAPNRVIADGLHPEVPCMTGATLYGLPNCDTCRKARNWLDRFGVDYRFVDYRSDPVPATTLKDWANRLGGWEKLVNKSSTTWRNLLPQRKSPGSDPEWTLLLKEYPALVRRPVVVREDGAVSVGFSDNGFKKTFGR